MHTHILKTFARVFVLLIILMLSVNLCFASSGVVAPSSRSAPEPSFANAGTFRLITYNIKGLFHGNPELHDNTKKRMKRVAQKIEMIAPDIFMIQENFDYNSYFRSGLHSYPYQSAYYDPDGQLVNGDIFTYEKGDGLDFFSKPPFYFYGASLLRQTWNVCWGNVSHGGDCGPMLPWVISNDHYKPLTAKKGFAMVKLTVAKGFVIDLYDLHMDVGWTYEDRKARRMQVDQFINYVKTHSRGNAVIIGGDFNMSFTDGHGNQNLHKLIYELDLSVTCGGGLIDSCGSIDYIMYRGNEQFSLHVPDSSYKKWPDPDGASAIFTLTKGDLEALQKKNIPNKVLLSLFIIKDQEFQSENDFLSAVKKNIDGELTARDKELILYHAKRWKYSDHEALEVEFHWKSRVFGNVALSKRTSQSSIYGPASSERAVDGNQNGNYHNHSVTHTQQQHGAWWQVDLKRAYKINSVKIFNRSDCCSERLNGFKVMIDERIVPGYENMPVGYGYTDPIPVKVPGMIGQKVKVALNGTNFLQLAEVEVYGTPVSSDGRINVAFGKTASQSSTYAPISGHTGPEKAIDGDRDGNFSNRSVSHTNNELGAWWSVDLMRNHQIHEIRIFNRTDCCWEKLSGFKVLLDDQTLPGFWDVRVHNANPIVIQTQAMKAGLHYPTARRVKIQLNGRNYLHLAEVEVYGIPVSSDGRTNVAFGKTATQSSFYTRVYPEHNGPDKAVDGNRDGNYSNHSVAHTKKNPDGPWLQVDLEKVYPIREVRIYNRTDCCQEQLANFDVIILDENKTQVASYHNPSSLESTFQSISFPAGTEGQYVKIKLRGPSYLHVAEVEVYTKP